MEYTPDADITSEAPQPLASAAPVPVIHPSSEMTCQRWACEESYTSKITQTLHVFLPTV